MKYQVLFALIGVLRRLNIEIVCVAYYKLKMAFYVLMFLLHAVSNQV